MPVSCTTSATASPSSRASSGIKHEVIKMASVIDQGDDSEMAPPTLDMVQKWHQRYITVMGAPPGSE